LYIPGGNIASPYTNWIMDLMSEDNYQYRKENEQLDKNNKK